MLYFHLLMHDFFELELENLKSQKLYRDQDSLNQSLSQRATLLNFSSNDYLGLGEMSLGSLLQKSSLDKDSLEELLSLSAGSTGARFTTGTTSSTRKLVGRAVDKWAQSAKINSKRK